MIVANKLHTICGITFSMSYPMTPIFYEQITKKFILWNGRVVMMNDNVEVGTYLLWPPMFAYDTKNLMFYTDFEQDRIYELIKKDVQDKYIERVSNL